jgi:hypothetical protein
VGSKTLGTVSVYLRAVCMNRNLRGVENFEEIPIRHSKFAAQRFAHEGHQSLLGKMKSEPWYGVAYIVRNAVSHNFHIEFGKLRDKIPISWRGTTITADMEGRRMTPGIFWHRPGYELFLEMQAFAELLPEP